MAGIQGKTLAIRENLAITGTANAQINISTGGTVQPVGYSGSATDISTGTLNANRLPTQTTLAFNILGRTNGTTQTAGNIGEILSVVNLTTGPPVVVPTNIATNLTSLTLTPGSWLVTASATSQNSTIANDPIRFSLNTVSSTMANDIYNIVLDSTTNNQTQYGGCLPVRFFNVSVNTTIYLVMLATHTGTLNAWGRIESIRIN
ncbi:MAG: hypothetical protein NT139_01120 [Candidatus Woesearchaeota archaeon]|nr:hypothetical protein [Candidatus Woesearchaeota archaeon]